MATLKGVVGNTAPPYIVILERDDGAIVPLTGCTVTMKLFLGKTQTNTVSGHDTCTVVDATAGTMSWTPKAGDLPNKGTYKGDVKVTYADTTFEVFYSYFKLKIRKLLGT